MPTIGSNHGAEKVPSEFGRMLRELRGERGMTQATVAKLAKVSPGYVGLIEAGDRGQRPSLDFVTRIAEALTTNPVEMEALLRASGHVAVNALPTPDEPQSAEEGPTFTQFVKSDPRLDKRQRKILIRLYESWLN